MSTFIRDIDIATKLDCHRATVWRLVKNGILPKPVKLGRAARWNLESVEATLERLNAEAQAAEAPTKPAIKKKRLTAEQHAEG